MILTKNPGSDTRFTALPNIEDKTSSIKMISGERLQGAEDQPATLRLEVRFKPQSGVTAEQIAEQLEQRNAQAADPTTVTAINPSGLSEKRNSLTFDVTTVDEARDLLTWLNEQGHVGLNVSEQKAFCTMCAEVGNLPDGLVTAASPVLSPDAAKTVVRRRVEQIQRNVLR